MTRVHYLSARWGVGRARIDYVFLVKRQATLAPNPNEVSEAAYLPPESVRELFSRARCEGDAGAACDAVGAAYCAEVRL